MGRHNTVAGRMAESAAYRGKLFTKLARLITVAARQGSDPSMNSALRTAIAKAKDNSMPKDNIDRAIKKGAGEGKNASQFEDILYEGRGPGGAGILVEVLTDNRNRTFPELRVIFQKNGGSLSEVGSIAWMFEKKGVFYIDLNMFTEDQILEIALECQIDDTQKLDDAMILTCAPTLFAEIREQLLSKGLSFQKAGIEYIPMNEVDLDTESSEKLKVLLDKLHDHDDVQSLFTNAQLNE